MLDVEVLYVLVVDVVVVGLVGVVVHPAVPADAELNKLENAMGMP